MFCKKEIDLFSQKSIPQKTVFVLSKPQTKKIWSCLYRSRRIVIVLSKFFKIGQRHRHHEEIINTWSLIYFFHLEIQKVYVGERRRKALYIRHWRRVWSNFKIALLQYKCGSEPTTNQGDQPPQIISISKKSKASSVHGHTLRFNPSIMMSDSSNK